MRLLYPACLIISLLPWFGIRVVAGMTMERRNELREETRQLFVHGYDGYMKYAYPADELRPISCTPLHRDPNPANFGVNDIHANASMTLLDVLSTLPLIHPSALPSALEKVTTAISFDQDVKVQVFEMTIRALGALLSTYQLLESLPEDPTAQAKALGIVDRSWVFGRSEPKVDVKRYSQRILELALDLGRRMLPAFNTPTGIPYARVNLRHGVEKGESIETCAGSLILEFSVLSRLTGDERFEKVAHAAYLAIWNRRSPQNLIANTVGVTHGQWLAPGLSGVGAGMDSFFEYGMKAGIMLGDDAYLDIFNDAYAALQTHVRTPDGFIYRPVQYRSLVPNTPSIIDSLSAFLPSVQVLAGDLESAIKAHLVFWNLWRKHSAIPESWGIDERKVEWTGWPGRPEFIESTYYLYRATKDPFYLRIGERVLRDIKRRVKTSCGFASLSNVLTGKLEDRMESFVLSETLKYLYLLFDTSPQSPLSNKVFTTEGHPLALSIKLLKPPSAARRDLHKGENLYCPIYKPPTLGGGIVVGIERRLDYEYARSLVFGPSYIGVLAEDQKRVQWWEGGFCPIPTVPKFSFDIILSPLPMNGTSNFTVPPEDPAPSSSKVYRDAQGNFVITDREGLKLGVTWRLDGRGYDVSNIGPHRVRPGQKVVVSDPGMSGYLPLAAPPVAQPTQSPPEVVLRFSGHLPSAAVDEPPQVFLHAVGATATFGKDMSGGSGGWGIGEGRAEMRGYISGNEEGCHAFESHGFSTSENHDGTGVVLMLRRGGCTFLEKLINAGRAGAIGVVIVGYQDPAETPITNNGDIISDSTDLAQIIQTLPLLFRPSADDVDIDSPIGGLKEIKNTGMIYVDHKVGGILDELLNVGGQVWVELLNPNGDVGASSSGNGGTEEGGKASTGRSGDHEKKMSDEDRERTEGRLVVSDWDIWNLRIVKAPP